jgi:hypothetical protein
MYLGGEIDCDEIPARIKYQGNNPKRWLSWENQEVRIRQT